MEKVILSNKKSWFHTTETPKYIKMARLLEVFLLFNTIKLVWFNYIIMYSKSFGTMLYKTIYILLIGLILYSLILKIKSRIPLIIFYLLQTIYLFAYLSYFSYFHGYLHLFQATALLTESVGPIKHLSIPINVTMLIVLIDLPVFIVLMRHYSKIESYHTAFKTFKKQILIGAIAILMCIEGWNYYDNCSIIQMGKTFYTSEPRIIERYGTFVNNISDIVFDYGGVNLINFFKYGKTIKGAETTKNHPNIIAIQVESMDANVINKKYNGEYIAPYLNSLSKSSIYYPYTMSYHKAGGTSDSEFSIMDSIEPLSNFPSIKISKYNYANSLVKRLDKGKYRTIAFHGNVAKFYSRDVAFPKMGFNEFDDIDKMGFKNVGWGAPDGDVLQYAYNKMKKQKKPFFSYVITMTSHMPFTSADNYYHNNNYNNVENPVAKNYFNSISYVDQSIKTFVEEVKATMPNTYIFIWGDHTPDIMNNDYMQASFTTDNKYYEFVPLLIVTPDNKVRKEEKNVASFLDIAPTILEATGIKFSIKSDGVNLINPPQKFPEIPYRESMNDREKLYKEVSGK